MVVFLQCESLDVQRVQFSAQMPHLTLHIDVVYHNYVQTCAMSRSVSREMLYYIHRIENV